MSESEEQRGSEGEVELVISSKTEEIVDKKGYTTSVIWTDKDSLQNMSAVERETRQTFPII